MIQYHIFLKMTKKKNKKTKQKKQQQQQHENRCVVANDFMISAPKHYNVTKGSGLSVTL